MCFIIREWINAFDGEGGFLIFFYYNLTLPSIKGPQRICNIEHCFFSQFSSTMAYLPTYRRQRVSYYDLQKLFNLFNFVTATVERIVNLISM